MKTAEKIASALARALSPERVDVADESAAHAGHAGAAAGGGHFALLVVAAAFDGKGALERHRLVYDALGELMKREVHALRVRALTPAEWSAEAAASSR